jgi:hypothetical protein
VNARWRRCSYPAFVRFTSQHSNERK